MSELRLSTVLDSPWLGRKDWAKGEVTSSDRKNLIGIWISTLIGCAISSGVFFIDGVEIKAGPTWFLLFPVLSLFLLLFALWNTFRVRKFGTSTFRMMSVPGVIGGTLSGMIQTRVKLHPKNGFRLHLRCIQKVANGPGKGRRSEESLLWEDSKIIQQDVAIHNQDRSVIPVFFEIPSHSEPTNGRKSIEWHLEVTAAVPGIDYKSAFEVPVFHFSEAPQSTMTAQEFAARFESGATHPLEMLKKTGVRVDETPGFATRFYFPRCAHPSMALIPLIISIGGAVGLYLLLRFSGDVFLALILGTFEAMFLFITVHLILKSTTVLADSESLKVDTDWLFFKRTRLIPSKDIQYIETTAGMRVGNTPNYDIRAGYYLPKQNTYRSIIISSGVKERKEAEWITEKLYAALKISRNNEDPQNTKS
ncbi:MAG: hypothetical protein ACK4UN_02950 [Limisphaerales bacterium]